LLLRASRPKTSLKNVFSRRRRRLDYWNRTQNWALRPRSSFRFVSFVIGVPKHWSLVILSPKKTNILYQTFFLYSDSYFFKVGFMGLPYTLTTNRSTQSVQLDYFYSSHLITIYFKILKLVFLLFAVPYFLKLKFRGKGYYIYKNRRNTVTPQMGFAHRIYVYAFSIIVWFRMKTKIMLFGLSKQDILRIGFKIRAIRPIKIFTGRGIRFTKQILYRKVGKVCTYR
jgi:hypothetical protein